MWQIYIALIINYLQQVILTPFLISPKRGNDDYRLNNIVRVRECILIKYFYESLIHHAPSTLGEGWEGGKNFRAFTGVAQEVINRLIVIF